VDRGPQVSALPPDKQQAANNLLTQATTALQRTSTEASKAATSQESSNNNQVKEQEHSLADTLKGLFEIFSLNDGPILERPLQMNGHDHTLYVSIQGGKPLVELASRRQDLLLLVWRARDQEKAGAKRGPLLQELAWAETKLKELLEFERAGAYSTRSLEDIKSDTETLANYLIDIGATFGIQDLENLGHPSKYVEGNILKEEYRSIVREKFYSSSYRTSTLEWKAKRLRTLLHPTDQAQFKDELTGTWEPRTIENTPDDNVTIDHIHKVVDHWNSGGNNMSQSERLDFYNDTSNLQLTTRAHNSTDGALARAQGSRYSSRVGDQFRGPIDDE
jgi:hypothetical protein